MSAFIDAVDAELAAAHGPRDFADQFIAWAAEALTHIRATHGEGSAIYLAALKQVADLTAGMVALCTLALLTPAPSSGEA